FDQFEPQPVFAAVCVLIDVAVGLQRFQERVDRALVQAGAAADFGDLQFGAVFIEQIEYPESTVDSLNDRQSLHLRSCADLVRCFPFPSLPKNPLSPMSTPAGGVLR